MFYIFIVWMIVSSAVIAFELILYSLTSVNSLPFSGLLPPPSGQIQQDIQRYQFGYFGVGLFAIFLVSVILGYLTERYLMPIKKMYAFLQKSFPTYYKYIPADYRELSICFFLFLILDLFIIGCWWLISDSLLYLLAALLAVFSFCLGLSILPTLRYRNMQLMDRPEKPIQALIHKVAPEFPVQTSLMIGQLYLKFLLPLFALILSLLVPLGLGIFYLSGGQYGLLMLALIGGISIGWYAERTSQISVNHFQQNLGHLLILLGSAVALITFGVASENLVVLLLTSGYGGYLVSSY